MRRWRVVIGVATRQAYFDGLNEKLLGAIPANARRVLELGCANGRLGEAFKRNHIDAHWTGVDISPEPLAHAATVLDQVILADLQAPDDAVLGGGYDTIVIGDLLEHLREPRGLLEVVHRLSAADARLVCCVPNMAHLSVLERLLAGDLSYDAAGLLDATHLRFMTPASTFKVLLDAGWLPHLTDHFAVGHQNTAFVQAVLAAAGSLGIPSQTAARNVFLYQMVLDCTKAPAPPRSTGAQPFSVVVAVNNPTQLALNVTRSPGLIEVEAPVIAIEHATSAADAFARGCERAATEWIVFCHQDVYFPSGSGRALASTLAATGLGGANGQLIGFAGIAGQAGGQMAHAGLVIDRLSRFDHPDSWGAVSIDEFAVALTRQSRHHIDPALGWHLWATDLCLAASSKDPPCAARIARVPLFHNSYNDGVLPPAFHESARRLIAKYPSFPRIPTLCGTIEAAA